MVTQNNPSVRLLVSVEVISLSLLQVHAPAINSNWWTGVPLVINYRYGYYGRNLICQDTPLFGTVALGTFALWHSGIVEDSARFSSVSRSPKAAVGISKSLGCSIIIIIPHQYFR